MLLFPLLCALCSLPLLLAWGPGSRFLCFLVLAVGTRLQPGRVMLQRSGVTSCLCKPFARVVQLITLSFGVTVCLPAFVALSVATASFSSFIIAAAFPCQNGD